MLQQTKIRMLSSATLLAAVLALAALAETGAPKEKPRPHPVCPMKVEGADVRVDTIESGAVIHITSKNPNVVKKIQDAALQMADGTTKKAAYACPMGDYSGVQTKDSRCPKCGMNLEKR